MTPDERYNRSEKGRARHRRYNTSPKGRARQARYEATRIRVGTGGFRWTYRVPAAEKDALLAKIAEFKASQQAEYQQAKDDGWFDPPPRSWR